MFCTEKGSHIVFSPSHGRGIKLFMLTVVICLSCIEASAQSFDREMIRAAIVRQMESYPKSTLKDIYKNFFQDAFGPGHLLTGGEKTDSIIRNALFMECQQAKMETNVCPDYESTGWHGRFYRVNLAVINDGRVPIDTFLSAFLRSALQFSLPDIEEWKEEWSLISEEVKRFFPMLPSYQQDSMDICAVLANNKYAMHHSDTYDAHYHPHYRLVERSIFEQELLPLINSVH